MPPAPPRPPGLRLVAPRSLWDAGTQVAHSPGLAGLHPDWVARVHPLELVALGVIDGSTVQLRTPRGAIELVVRADRKVARGSVVVPFNRPGGSASGLIDAAAPVTAVTLDPVAVPGVGAGPALGKGS
jgi:formate dehydrogenase major subunit